MSFLNDKTKFTVKTSNLSTVAKFSSTLDDAYFLILAQNSNNIQYGCNASAAVFGATSTSNFEAYIGVAKDNMLQKLARFNNTDINLNANVIIEGNIVPTSNLRYSLGTPEYKWKDLYLSGSTIYLGETVLSSDKESGTLTVKNSSNEIAPMVASRIKLVSSGNTSNYSIFSATDYGVNLTYYDQDGNIINHLDLGLANTSMLPEGSNLYYTFERFDQRLLTKTLDNLIDGTSNRYITNDIYYRDLQVTGTLRASNMIVYGDKTVLNTETYQTEQLEISSDANGPVLTIQQKGSGDVFEVLTGSNSSLLVNNQGFVGINNSNPEYNLDVSGIANATYLKGEASQLWNVNLQDRTTDLLLEGSNLYYTSERVGIIATSSNIDTSNYIRDTSNAISARLTDTSNLISDRLTDTSNLISDRLTDTSNLISDRLTDTSNLISDRLTNTSNLISDRITTNLDLIATRITDLTTDQITEATNLFYTTQRFDERLLTKTLDDIVEGTSNRYIVNDTYNRDLNVTGTLTTSNLIVHGSFTTLDTVTYQTKKLEIVSDSEDPALLVRQTGNSNIIEVYDDTNIVLSITNGGFVGINKHAPEYALDIVGTLKADYLIGDGSGLVNVSLADKDTSLLKEGSNLYYTSERVGIISTACNVDTSNYILWTSNYLTEEMRLTADILTVNMTTASNVISDRITNLSSADVAEGTNLFYTTQRFDERLDSKTADYLAIGTSNRYIVNDIYNRDLTISGTLSASNLVVSGDITTLNTNTYQSERMEIISDVAGPALRITQHGTNDIMHVYDDENIAFAIVQGGNVGVNTLTPLYTLDIAGTARASLLIGDGAGLSNVNLADRDTSMLAEGSNLYYTSERVGVIATASNLETSNYILTSSNYLITKILDTSNMLTDTINNVVSVQIANTCNYLIMTSNILIENIISTSNILTAELNDTIANEINTTIANLEYTSNVLLNLIINTSNELTSLMNNVVAVQVASSADSLTTTSNELIVNLRNTSNQLTNTINNVVSIQITNASNMIVNTSNLLTANLTNYFSTLTTRVNKLTTNNIPEGSNLYYTDARFSSMLQTKTLDDIRDGTSNRYIVNDRYTGDIYISGTLSTSNLIVNGTTTTLNTTTYQSKKLEIISDAVGPALKVQQNGIFDIMQVYDDSNIVLSIVNGGRVGVNTSNPAFTFDVVGTSRSTFFIGDASGLTNVNLSDRSTSMLVEGSNLYYTSERVGVIASACNVNTSNYVLVTSNVISDRITNVSNVLSANLYGTSNTLYANLIHASNLISLNLFITSNYLMNALITTSNLAINTSNEIMTNLNNTYNTYTSNFLANSNLLSSNILVTSNNIANLIASTYSNINTNISDTSNALINNILNTSNNLINNTSNTFVILSNNLTNVSNIFASNIPIIYKALYDNLYNISNVISSHVNNASNSIAITINNNCNLFINRITDASNVISNSITLSSNELATNMALTSNLLSIVMQEYSNQIYVNLYAMSNSLSVDILQNSNVISNRITALNLDMINPGTSNTYIVNNIYDANLTITGKLIVDSLDVVDLGLLVLNDDGQYINTDMKTYVARITSNVLVAAPAIILNASNNFKEYDSNQSNYISTKINKITGAATSIVYEDLTANRVVVTNNSGKLAASSVSSASLEMIAGLNAPVQTQINNLNISSSNLAASILDRLSFLNDTIGTGSGGTGNNLSVTNTVTTCNLVSYDPLLFMKFEDLSDSSKYASKNYLLMQPYPSYSGHTKDLMLWYKFNGNTNNWINNVNSNLYLINGLENYSPARVNGLSALNFNGYTSYTMGFYNNTIIPAGIQYANGNSMTIQFWMNASTLFVGRQYVFSYSTSNFLNASSAIEAYISTSNLCLSVSKGISSNVYNIPMPIQPNIFYNIGWEMTKTSALDLADATWDIYINGLQYSNVIGYYPLNHNYTYNAYGGQASVYSSNFFNGNIDDFRVYNRALNWYEVHQNAGINYPSYDNFMNDLLLWYNFDGHLHNYDGNSNYVLTLAAGTLSYIANNNTSLYNLYFNGSTYLSMNTNSMINFGTVYDIYPRGLTFSIVFNTTSVATATQYLFSMTDTLNSTTPTRSIEVFLTTNQLNFRIRQNGTTTMQTVTLNSNLVAYKYYNLVWVITQGTASWNIYLNGLNVYTSDGDRFYPISGTYRYNYIGSLYNTSYFGGSIDDFRVYKKSLSNEEVVKISTKTLKYGSFTNHTNNLVSWFNFDNDYRNTLFDASIPLVYLNFADKKMITYADTDNYIFYNTSNVAGNVYANIGNFRVLNTEIPEYTAANSYALVSGINRYIYYTNQFELINMLKFIGNNGFVIHFAMKADKMNNIPIFYLGNGSKRYIQVLIYYGCIYMIVGEGSDAIHIYTDNNLNTNTWYVVDIVGKIDLRSYKMSFEMYVNGIRQNVLTTSTEYKPASFLYGYETTGIYVGGYNPRNNGTTYSSDGYAIGAVLTATYYSANTKYYDSTGLVSASSINILNMVPSNSATFNSYINQANVNNYWAFRDSMYLTSNELMSAEYVIDSSNYFALNNINPADINSMFVEIVGNFYVESDAYYHFAIDLQNEIACELVLSGVNNFGIIDVLIVAAYYGSFNNVLQYPVMLNAGYYKLSLKILRRVVDINKYVTCKYYKYVGYTGMKYSILSKNVAYMNYQSLSSSVKDGMVALGDKIYIANVVENFATGNLTIKGDDFGVLTLGSALTSNAMGLGSSNFAEYAGVLANVMGSNFPIKQFSNIANVSAGSNHTLVLLNNGSVYSCGANYTGQLGLGITMNNTSYKFLKQVKGVDGLGYITDIIQVSAGDSHSMFLKSDGNLYACGLNVFGQLGLGNTDYAYNVLKQTLSDVKYVSAGVNTTLVIKNDNSAWGCGRNDTGQLAQGMNYTLSSSFIPIMDVGYSNALTDMKEVQAGGSWSLFLKNDGNCYASGGLSNMMSLYQIVGSNVDYMSNIAQISAKADFGAMFLANNSDVFRAGSNLLNVPGTVSKVVTTTAISKVAQGKNIYYIGQNGKGYTSSSLSFSCGNDTYGQLALGDSTKYFVLKQVQGMNGSGYISGITQIAAGNRHTLFLHSSGAVYGVGANGRGQLGLNEISDIYTIQQVKGVNGTGFISGIIQVSASEYESLFLHSSGAVYGCGFNTYGQLGLNNTTQYTSLQQVKGVGGTGTISGITQITMNTSHSLFLHSTGIVYACGGNSYGQLGLNNYNQYTTLQQVKGVGGTGTISGITQISAGNYHSLFLHSSGAVYACGTGVNGQLGLNDSGQYTSLQQVKGVGGTGTISGITQISAGSYHSLFLHSSGIVYTCGDNSYGQLGLNNMTAQSTLQQVLGVNGSGNISGVTKISAGDTHSIFLSSDGTVYVCGNNSDGQLGLNNATNKFSTVQQVKGVDGSGVISGIIQITAGRNVSFYLNSSGYVYGSGDNGVGRIGLLLNTPQQVLGVNGVGNITGITKTYWSPYYAAIYLHASGKVYVSGNNQDGQLGLNNKTNRNTLQQVLGVYGTNYMSGIVNAAGGNNFSLFVDSSGAVYSSGTNNYGQMGINLTVPRPVSGLNGLGLISGIIQVSAAYYSSLFLHSSGIVYGCGYNNSGELGLNNITPYTVLQQVLGVNGSGYITGITQISAGYGHCIFLHNSGVVYSTGLGNSGQLGIIGFSDTRTLQQVKGVNGSGFISGIIQVSASASHSVFLHNSGIVYSCGNNAFGKLGLNDTSSRETLQQVLGVNGSGFISGITQIVASANNTICIGPSGFVYACGWNAYGQLGLNNTTNYSTLQQVLGVNGSGFISGITKVSNGGSHALFLHNSGAVYSCGQNNYGQLGLNEGTSQYNTLQQVRGLGGSGFVSGITQLAAVNASSFFVHSSGSVYCCGYNQFGDLGLNNTGTQYSSLQKVLAANISNELTGIIQVSGGHYGHTLFLDTSGTVYACGYNLYGQLGFNYIVPNPVQGVNGFGLATGIKQVVTGSYHSLFLHSSGAVYSCGRNASGQLGLNNTVDQTVLKQVLGINGSGFISGIIQISAANVSSFFVHSSGSVYSCGSGSLGNLGLNNYNQYNSLQQVLGVNGSGFISGIIQVAAGERHTLFLHSSGIVYACGYNAQGPLGLNNTTAYYITLQQVLGVNGVGFISGIIQVAASSDLSLFLHSSGVVYACGLNTFGQLGLFDGVSIYSSLQQVRKTNSLSYLEKIMYVSAGYNASSYVQFADFGDLFFDTDVISSNVSRITQISAYNHLLLTDANNVAFSTGANTYAQLANNTNIDQFNMQYVLDGEGRFDARNIVKVVPYCSGNSSNLLNAQYSLFLSKDGAVYFSGESGRHSAGIPTTPYLTYMSSLAPYKIIDMACGSGDNIDSSSNYNLFVTNTGNVYSIPYNNFIREANGSNLTNIVKVACRKNNWLMYFIDKNGLVYQSTASLSSISPVMNVVGLGGQGIMRNIKQVEGGLSFTVFLANTGDVYAVGDNTYGQLGTGNNTAAAVPTYMLGVNGVQYAKNIVEISCGNYYTLLLARDTKVLATGYNVGGILGIGTTVSTNVLKEVLTIDGTTALTGIKDISCGVANIIQQIAPVLLLGQDNNIYIPGPSTASTGLLTLLNSTQNINRTINSVHAAGAWLFLNTVKYDNQLLYDSSNQFAFTFDEKNSPYFYVNDSNYVLNIQDVRMYTPDIMGQSNVIANQLVKGVYNPSTNPAPNNMIFSSNTSFDFATYYSGYASLAFTASNNSFAYLQSNFYNFGSSDTTISMWVKGSDVGLKYPNRAYTSNDNNIFCTSSTTSNVDCWRCFDNTSNSLNINTFTQIYSIGYNNVGQLGDASSTNRTAGYVPVVVPASFNETITLIAGTANVTGWTVHMLTDAGRAYSLQQAGLTLVNPNNFSGEKISFIASGRSTYFITESGLLYAYGDNSYWQLGNGNNTSQNTPILIPASRWNGEKVAYVATGSYHTYIITDSGTIFTIGYNNNGQLGKGNNTNQTTWTLFTALSDVLRIYCAGDQTYIITKAGLLYSVGVRGNVPFLESSIPSNKRIIKISFSPGNCAFALADDGTVFGYGNNPISMPNTTSAQTAFIEMTSSVWTGSKIVDVVTAGDHTFYTTDRGLVYVVGNNNYGQLNIPTTTASSKTPLLVNVGGRINQVYGGLHTTGYNIVVVYPPDRYIEFGGNSGEFVKVDVLENVAINYAQISLTTPASTTSLSYAISMRLFACNGGINNPNVLWDLLGTYDGTLSYSAGLQNVILASTSLSSYRYYAILINSRYNINVNEIGLYTANSISSKKCILDARINSANGITIMLESNTITASVIRDNVATNIAVSHANIYNKGILYTLTYKYNTDPNDATWRAYTNGLLVQEKQPMPYPETGNYSTIYVGRSVNPVDGIYNYFNGNIDDFRIYNRFLTGDEILSIYSADKFNIEGSSMNTNRYALSSARDTFVYNVNYNDLYGLMRNIDANGFTIHFVFKTNDVNNASLYYVGGRSSKIMVKVIAGVLYIMLGTDVGIVSRTRIVKDTWYNVDIMVNIMANGTATIQLYLNGTVQQIYANNALNTSHLISYSNLVAPDNVPLYGMYIGANNVANNIYRDESEIVSGALFTNTYYSSNLVRRYLTNSNVANIFPSIMSRPAVGNADFSNLVVGGELYYSYKISSNVLIGPDYQFAYNGSNFLYDRYVTSNLNSVNLILTEIDANVKLQEGFYYFVNDVENEITAELYLGTEVDRSIRDFTLVGCYYGSNLNGGLVQGLNRTTALPVYVAEGYYKFHSKVLTRNSRKYLHHKYIKLANYTGDYYSLVSHIVDYQVYTNINAGLRDSATLMYDKLYVPRAATNNILIDTGGTIDAGMMGWGQSVYFYDNGCINRGNVDSGSTTYVNLVPMGQPDGCSLIYWGMFTTMTGRTITPLILEFTGGTNYILRGAGRSRTITTSGLQSYAFDTVGGSNIFLTSNYRFAWKDGTLTTTNAGVISYDNTNSLTQSTYSMSSAVNMSVGSTYSYGSAMGNRTYSFKLEFATTSNYQFGSFIYEGSNYNVGITSNYNAVMTSNYSVAYSSNYNVIMTSNYSVNVTSNYSEVQTSNYIIEMTSNYSVIESSNYTIDMTSNYNVSESSNYGDNETSNYDVAMTSNYSVIASSNYTVDMTSNYSVAANSNYTIDMTSNYSIVQSSNYYISMTSNYNMIEGSNYTVGLVAQWSEVYTSNYIVPYVANYLLPQNVFDLNNYRYMRGVSSICNGASHTVILRFDGSVFSCGQNLFGQLGIGSIVGTDRFVPVLDVAASNIVGIQNVRAISCGMSWSHFVKGDGTVVGCGMNVYGNLGDNTTIQRNRVVQVVGVGGTGVLTGVRAVAGGFGDNCVTLFLRSDGTVVGCGNNTFGTLGDNSVTQRNAVVSVLGVGGTGVLSNIRQVCTNATTSVFLANDGTCYACGGNSFGQIGDNTIVQRNTVVQVRGIAGFGFLTNITQIAANGDSMHTLFLRGDGVVYGCGFNGFGQLGRNNTTNLPHVMRVMSSDGIGTISGVIQIGNNANSSYFLIYDGSLMACGGGDVSASSNYGNYGQLGIGGNSNALLPTFVRNAAGTDILVGVSQLGLGGINNMNVVFNNGNKELVRDSNMYFTKSENEVQNVLIQDFRIYNSGAFSSNILNVYGVGGTSVLNTAYSTYSEITDANRWMKSKDYYLYNNGVFNRNIYYTEGNVGIGTSAPTATLEIYTSDSTLNSIKTNNAIWAQTGVISSSDARIKKNIRDIDDFVALDQILKIEPKTYNYIDKARGDRSVYGFIAQQIGEVIPNAVSVQTECIPNIFREARVQDKNVLVFAESVSDKVYAGCKMNVVISNGEKICCEVLQVSDMIVKVDSMFEDEKVFVYGTVVDDFHTLDKSYVYTLNVCATQDLYRQLQANKVKLEEQSRRIEMLMAKLDNEKST